MLKFLRKYKQVLLVVAGVLLMIAFLLPQAIEELTQQRANVTVMKIGQQSVSARQHHEMLLEYEFLNRLSGGTLPMMGITEGPEQWILLSRLAERGGYVGASPQTDEALEDIGRTLGLARLRMQFGDSLNSLMAQPQFAGFLEGQIQGDVEQVKSAAPQLAADIRLTDKQVDRALAKLQGVNRLIRAETNAARVSTPRALQRAERELEGVQVEYIFIPADRQLENVPAPDDAALQAFMEKYKDVRPGEGEYGIGYLLPDRIKLEYLVLDATRIGEKITPDLRELRKRFNEMPNKDQGFDAARPTLEAQVRKEMVEKVMAAAREAIIGHVGHATRTLAEDGHFKVLPENWAEKRPTLADIAPVIVKHVEEKTRPEPGKPGIQIDLPQLVVKDERFLTADELAELEGIGQSYLPRGQNQAPFPDYALAVHELAPNTPLTLQVGLPSEEPTQTPDGSRYYFTILDTRKESSPRSIDEVRERLVSDWKKVEAYKLLVANEQEALKQKAIAEGITSLDESLKNLQPGEQPTPQVKGAKVTRARVSSGDANVNTDTFRLAVMEQAEKLDPLTSADDYPESDRFVAVPIPEKLGIAVARIRSLVPLTVEDFRGQQNGLVNQYQLEEFRSLKANPFGLDRLRQRLNVRYVGRDGEETTDAEANVGS